MGHITDAETVEFPITVTYDYAKGAEFVSVLNQARKAAGLPAVIQTGTLTEIAKIRAREAQFWMEHGSPDEIRSKKEAEESEDDEEESDEDDDEDDDDEDDDDDDEDDDDDDDDDEDDEEDFDEDDDDEEDVRK
jgi:hypothetical protein